MNISEIAPCILLIVYLGVLNLAALHLTLFPFLILSLFVLIVFVGQRLRNVIFLMQHSIMMLDALAMVQKRLSKLQNRFEAMQARQETKCE